MGIEARKGSVAVNFGGLLRRDLTLGDKAHLSSFWVVGMFYKYIREKAMGLYSVVHIREKDEPFYSRGTEKRQWLSV